MRLNPPPDPIDADDAAIRRMVAAVDVVPLLAAVAQVTGEMSILRTEFRPDVTRALEPNSGMTPEHIDAARQLAADALIAFRDRGGARAALPDGEALRALVEFVAGGALHDGYYDLIREELALGGNDQRAPRWTAGDIAPDRPMSVAIIGSGMSGLLAAHRLLQAGVSITIFEKNPDLGGTWFENTYPGCRVDIPTHFYSYSFAQTIDWPHFYSSQPVLLEYFRTCARELGIAEHIRFSTEVISAAWDDERAAWSVHTRTADGAEHTAEFNAVVSAVGQLNRPNMPDIDGIDDFAGPWFHSAHWDHSLDLAGKRVGIIGTGASAAQFIPAVAEVAGHLTVFQRTPPWLLPVPHYQDEVPGDATALMRVLPEYARWDRICVFWRTHEVLLQMAVVDPDWPDQSRSVSGPNEMLRALFTMYFDVAVPDEALRAKLVPQYPPIAKRIVLDNGSLPAAYQRDNVDLVTDGIERITGRGLRTRDGVEHEFDVLIYGTGFQASRFLTPMRVTGAGGVDLHERWAGDARAYLGIVVPEFPNFFLMYGPNTNIVVNGSIIYFSECETHFIVESVRMLLEQGAGSMDCRAEVHDAYNERIDAGNRAMAWGASDVSSWYKNEFGRSAQNWPFSLLEYWEQTRAPDPADFVLRPQPDGRPGADLRGREI